MPPEESSFVPASQAALPSSETGPESAGASNRCPGVSRPRFIASVRSVPFSCLLPFSCRPPSLPVPLFSLLRLSFPGSFLRPYAAPPGGIFVPARSLARGNALRRPVSTLVLPGPMPPASDVPEAERFFRRPSPGAADPSQSGGDVSCFESFRGIAFCNFAMKCGRCFSNGRKIDMRFRKK